MNPLFGRATEIASVERFMAGIGQPSAGSGRPSQLVISGDVGVGKTALWLTAIRIAGDAGYQVLTSRCAETESKLSFTALGDLIGPVAHDLKSSLAEPLRRALDIALLREDPGPVPTDWRAVGLAVLEVFRALSARSPVLTAIDDVQWLDGPSARVLSFALRRMAGSPVGCVATERSGPLTGSPGPSRRRRAGRIDVNGPEATTELSVGPLDADNLRRAVQTRVPRAMSDARLAYAIKQSAGNPFFAIELAAAMAEADATADIRTLPVPDAIATLIVRHLRRMPADARELVAVSAMTTALTIPMARQFFGGMERTDEALGAAVAAEMLTVDAGKIRPAHPLLGATASAEVPAARRRDVHRRLADLVDDEEERAIHLGLATVEPDDEVSAILEKAAAHARLRGALEAAAALSQRAAELTPSTDRDGYVRRIVQSGEYRWQIGDMTAAGRLMEAALPLLPAGPLRARALLCLGRVRFHSQVAAAADATREALELCGDDMPLRIQALIDHAFIISNTADRPVARQLADQAVTLCGELADDDLRTQALTALALFQAVDGDAAADATLEQALAIESAIPHLPPARSPTFIAGLRALWKGDVDTARSRMEAAYQRAVEWGEESSIPDVLVQLADLECHAGRWDAAAAHAALASQLAGAATHERVQASAVAATAMVAALRGDVPACRTAVETGWALSAKTGGLAGVVACASAVGLLSLSLGDYQETHEQLAWLCDSFVIRSHEPAAVRFITDEVEALIGLGDLAAARTILDEYENRARKVGSDHSLAAALRCRGVLNATVGDLPGATAALEQAVRLAGRFGLPFDLARTHLAYGSVLRRSRRWRDARTALERAAESFDALGAVVWAANARRQLSRVGGRQRGTSALTPGETQIARLAAAGRTNREIAAELFVSVRAVEKALTNAYRKIGVRSRTELAGRLPRVPS